MKKKFSKSWISSKQPRKQRKYRANAPLHVRQKLMRVNLSKALREKHKRKNILIHKGDKVKVMRGKFSKKEGKVNEILLKHSKIYIEGIQSKKRDGSNANFPIRPSNLQIVELNLDDKKRLKSINRKLEKEDKKQDEKKKGNKTESKDIKKPVKEEKK